jgi:hypothetical protein
MGTGVLLFISPFVFGETTQGVAAATAYVLGVLLFLAGLLGEGVPKSRGVEIVPAVIGVVTFLAPWILGFAAVTGVAWAAWVLGIVALLAAGYRLFETDRTMSAA